MALFKAQAHMRELKQRLSLLLPSDAQADSLDANGMPQLKVAASGENIFVKIQALADGAAHVDGLGLAQRVYSPHECLILREDGATASDVVARNTILAACAKLGMKLSVKEAAGVGAAASYAAAEALSPADVIVLPSDEIHKLTMSQ